MTCPLVPWSEFSEAKETRRLPALIAGLSQVQHRRAGAGGGLAATKVKCKKCEAVFVIEPFRPGKIEKPASKIGSRPQDREAGQQDREAASKVEKARTSKLRTQDQAHYTAGTIRPVPARRLKETPGTKKSIVCCTSSCLLAVAVEGGRTERVLSHSHPRKLPGRNLGDGGPTARSSATTGALWRGDVRASRQTGSASSTSTCARLHRPARHGQALV